ncbi:hypothetical protein [Formosa sp. A9]|uniref:hypothetical protein n=1 Tax=Formosa sp. A9 TaxID=3442641 RepID=UPI003EBE6F60
MKLATFNIENLFHRDRKLMESALDSSRKQWIQEMDELMIKTPKTVGAIARIRELAYLLGFENITNKPYALLSNKDGILFFKGCDYSERIKATLINNWNGWLQLQTQAIPVVATSNKARVISEINPDILVLQEVEDRISLEQFNKELLPKFQCAPYKDIQIIQNNIDHGLETALLLREGYELLHIKTHYQNPLIEFKILMPDTSVLHLLAINFKKTTNENDVLDEKRAFFSLYLAKRYEALIAEGNQHIVIAGSLGAPSYCYSVAPLIQKTSLKDITRHLSFEVILDQGVDEKYHRLGAYRKGVNIKQTDYMLLSPRLFEVLVDSGLNRKGMWPKHRPQFHHYKSIKNSTQAASSHPLVWGKLKFH